MDYNSNSCKNEGWILFLLVLVTFAVRAPLLFDARPNDYDNPTNLITGMKHIHAYRPQNAPGHPLYEMGVTVLYHKVVAPLLGESEVFDGARVGKDLNGSQVGAAVVFKFIGFGCALLVLFLFYTQLREIASPWLSFFVCAAV